jgi:signal transduction histidine kinase
MPEPTGTPAPELQRAARAGRTPAGRKTTAILSREELLRSAVHIIRETFSYFMVNIFLVDGEELVLAARSMPRLQNAVGTRRLKIGREGITGWVAAHNQPLNIPDVRRDGRYACQYAEELGTRSELAVPITLQGVVTGVLDVESAQEGAFTDLDIFTPETVADQLTIAIENARLFGELRRELGKIGLSCALQLVDTEKDLFTSGSLVAPLCFEDRLLGFLSVRSAELAEEAVPALRVFANEIADAWRKAQLVRDLEESLRRLRHTQEQLLQSQKMEAVDRLAGGVAHDFNNQLTAILGYAESLLADLPLDDRRRAGLEQIVKAAHHAAGLTRQLLAFSRKQVLQPRVVDPNVLIEETLGMLRPLIGEDVRLETSYGRGHPARARRSHADPAGDHEPGGELPGRNARRRDHPPDHLVAAARRGSAPR